MNKTYFIKPEYKHKDQSAPSTARNHGSEYWSEHRIDSSNYYQHSVYTEAVRRARERFGKDFSVIDVGCGSGNKLVSLVAPFTKNTTGVDQEFIIEKARSLHPDMTWFVNDLSDPATSLHEGSKYDLVICSDVIEHLVDPDVLLSKIKDVMHSRSLLVLSTPERDILRGKDSIMTPHPEHIREWNTAELRDYLQSEGFVVEEMANLAGMKAHPSVLYMNFLRRNIGRTRYCMTAFCSLQKGM